MSEPGETQSMTTPPPPPPGGPGEGGTGNPWERRDTLGIGAALVEAVKLFITDPRRAFAETRPSGDIASPLLFAIVLGWVGIVIGQIWSLMFNASLLSMMPGLADKDLGGFATSSAAGFIFSVIFAPIFIAIALFVWSGILHLCMTLVGGLEQSTAGFEGTFRVVSYSSVTQLANIVPIIGGLISFVWSIVLGVIGLVALHKTSQNKALLAILIPVILCCVCFSIAMFAGMASLMAMFAGQGS